MLQLPGGLETNKLPPTWIAKCKVVELYDNYLQWSAHEVHASLTLFRSLWEDKWSKVIKMRGTSQHAMCTECVMYANLQGTL